MFGNWSQHVFIDPKAPQNCYRMTYNCINCADNQKTFNDGYHIIHHLNSKLHWTQLPIQFMETIEKHIEEGALVFEGIGFFDVGLAIFTGRLDWLADSAPPAATKEDTLDVEVVVVDLEEEEGEKEPTKGRKKAKHVVGKKRKATDGHAKDVVKVSGNQMEMS
eukprot:jgi/Pico_ML_1/54036/g455.t2